MPTTRPRSFRSIEDGESVLKTALCRKQWTIAFVFYLAASLVYFLPSLGMFGDHLIGPPEDNMFILWSLWYGASSWWHAGAGFLHTHQIFYPEGISLFFCNYYFWGVFLAFFLKLLFAMPLVYNLLVVHTFVLAGLGACFLIHELTGDFKAALVGGFVFAFNPSHWAHSLHHLTIASIQFIPFFAAFTIRAARKGKKSDMAWAAFFMTLDALSDWNYLVYDLLFLGLGLLYLIFRNPRKTALHLKRLAPIPLAACVCLSPLIVPMVWVGWHHPFVETLPGHDTYVADFLGFFVPDPYHFLGRTVDAFKNWNAAMTGNDWEKTVYLGWSNLCLFAAGGFAVWKKTAKYFAGFLAFLVLAMGSHPHFLGRALPFPFPYRLIQALPFLTQARNPSRIIVYAYLFLAILVAFSVRALLVRLKTAHLAKMAAAVMVFLIFLDFAPPGLAMTPVALPAGYDAIVRDPDKNFGLLELPWDGARYMMYQTMHGIPCVQGYMGRRIEKTLVDRLIYDVHRLPEQKKMLIESHVKYIVLYKTKIAEEPGNRAAEMRRFLMTKFAQIYARAYEKIYEDEDMAVFKVY